ncbi:MAG: GNAT family N-acetyltransferase [Bacteroidales bacterium]|nr:GNAT family N-acetyltransferase [Bacteroidales bacterium]
MEIIELNTLKEQDIQDLLGLMEVLDGSVKVTPEILTAAAQAPETHLFAAVEDGRIIGTASLCITRHPLGLKGGIEDVVVSPEARGRHIGRKLMEHIIEYARGLAPIELHLSSRPSREKANLLYQALGFRQHVTNVYKLSL